MPRLHEQVAAHVDHTETDAVALDHAPAVPRLAAQEVGRPHDLGARVQVLVDVGVPVCVVSEGDHVDASAEDLVGGLGSDAHAAGGVLAVDHDEVGRVPLA
jgi:hypothetical protein